MKKNKIFLYLGILLAILLVLSAIFQILTPKSQEIPQTKFVSSNNSLIKQQQSEFSQVVFTGKAITLPAKMTVSKIIGATNESDVVSQITTKYGLTKDPTDTQSWSNERGQSLRQDQYNKKYRLSLITSLDKQNAVTDHIFSKEELIAIASDQLAKLFPDFELQPLPQKTEFLKRTVEFYQATTLEKADLINVFYAYMIDGYPLKYKKASTDPFMVTLNNQGQVVMIDFAPMFIELQPVAKSQSISLSTAIANINNNRGSIISFGIKQGIKTDLSIIKSAKLKTATVEYRLDEELGLAYPFYRFSGTARDSSNQEITVEIITPAVQTSSQ